MPLYEYRCRVGDRFEAIRPVAERDAEIRCRHGHLADRVPSVPQRVIVRPAGYSLRPGDAGYWDFETSQGRLAPHERRQIAPFQRAEEDYVNPPKPVDDDVPVVL